MELLNNLLALGNIAALLGVMYLLSYSWNRNRPNPHKEAMKIVYIMGWALTALCAIISVYIILFHL